MKKQDSLKCWLLELLLAIASCTTLHISCSTVFIVVHGTWGRESEWYLPHGDFFTALETSANKLHAKVVSFTWSGGNNNNCRIRAAESLTKLILSYPPETRINLVSHSHGSNVAILTSKLLATHDPSKYHIYQFYALGTPVDPNNYLPDMRAVQWFYHFFSLGDLIQPVFGLFERCYPPHARIANIRVIIDDRNPGHKELHAPEIGMWLPAIHKLFAQQKIHGFEQFDFAKPGLIHFKTGKLPKYEVDTERNILLAKDHKRLIALHQAIQYERDKTIKKREIK